MASTCFRVSQNVFSNVKGIVRWNFSVRAAQSSTRNFATASKETESATPELSEQEKKFAAEVENLNKDISSLKEKCSELDDKYKRSLAESENVRRRLTKQIEDAKLFGIQGFCKDLLSVSDILHCATESVPADQLDANPHLKNLYQGLTMTEQELKKVFKRHGLAQVSPLNEKFNPNFHEAIFQQSVEGKEPGTVIAVTKVGYTLHERVVRPALVGVSK